MEGTAGAFDYHAVQRILNDGLEEAIRTKTASSLSSRLAPIVRSLSSCNSDMDVRVAVDSCIRDAGVRVIEENSLASKFESLLDVSIELAKSGVSTISLPISLLSDVFDVKTLEDCEQLFALVESRLSVWKSAQFFMSIKNQLLRTCNDLLRRLSRFQNTLFCGRILVFLARFFPLFERSGLNMIGEFNRDNVTPVSVDVDGEAAATCQVDGVVDLEEGEEATTATTEAAPMIAHSLHRKLWLLQDFFRQPHLCYQEAEWQRFESSTSEVLAAFAANRLDPSSCSSSAEAAKSPDNIYFAKYLTNQKLLELQLSDSNFRRYILIQFLIIFQHLNLNVKTKPESQVLTDAQKSFLKESAKQVTELIVQTPPNGAEMARVILQMLHREEYWNEWKSDKCPELKANELPKPRVLADGGCTRGAGQELLSAERLGKHCLGNKELTRLWNLCPDNWQACRSKKRVFTPSVEEYFEEIANSSKDKRLRTISGDPNFTWRGLRLLSQKSSFFFAPSNQLVRPVCSYMESVVENLAEMMGVDNSGSVDDMDDAEDISDDEFLKCPEDGGRESNATSPSRDAAANGTSAAVTKELVARIASKVASSWKKLAKEFTFQEDEIEYWDSETPSDPTLAAEKMLLIWIEQFPEDATVGRLQQTLAKLRIDVSI